MPQSLSKVYVHIVFSTKDRFPFLDLEISKELYKYIGGVCRELQCWPIEIGGHRDHIHILCTLSKNISQTTLLEEIKKRSSKWIKPKGLNYSKFYWQKGYAIFSVSADDSTGLIRYIQNQEEQHRAFDFRNELRKLFKRYKVDYDERYVWD